ncbi:MAG: hypothetical protein QM724_07125 [Flavobacteriales bacterium]
MTMPVPVPGKQQVFLLVALLLSVRAIAQDIRFAATPGQAELENRASGPYGLCVDSLVVDTVYYEDPATGLSEPAVQRYPLARYEYFADQALYRRIDIHQEQVPDTALVLDLNSGGFVEMVDSTARDVPNGAYHEFFPNGNIRVKGRLDGYNADGTLKRTGEWTEWDADGKVVRRETYP